MSAIYMPDTNALSVFARNIDAAMHARFVAEAASIRVSTISWYELRYGVEKRPDLSGLSTRLEKLRATISDLAPFDEDAAWHAGRVRAWLETLKPNAAPIGHYDTLLAGHALSLGAVLVTHNTAEFSRVPGLVVEDWQT
ncbi:MAG: hypothetical protein RL376_773, partial [Verrucomicrobiota bacterium]